MNAWRVVGVLMLIGAEALLYGYSYPFFSLALEKQGLANWLIGLNASLAGAGILFLGPFLPRAIDRLGINVLVALLFAGALAAFAAILTVDQLFVWFAARFAMGTCFAALWTTTEIWLNGIVDDRHRGRIIGGSGTLYAICQFVGPAVLGVTGAVGPVPLLVAMAPLAFGAMFALFIGTSEGPSEASDHGHAVRGGLRTALTLAGPVIVAAFLAGIGETALQSLLPLYGLAKGLGDAGAAGLVAVFALGEAVLVMVLGWMADRYGRGATLKLAAITATLTMGILPFAARDPLLLDAVIFLAGGAISGIYALGVILIGSDFRGQTLAVVSTGFGMAYSAGSIVGATPIGLAIDAFGVEALPLAIAVGFAGLTVFLFVRPLAGKAPAIGAGRAEPPDLAVRRRRREAPSIETPESALSFYIVGEVDAVSLTTPATAGLEMAPDWKRQERHLEDWFRERAAELARLSAERDETTAPAP